MRREAPEPWASAMKAAGAVDPRNGAPSMNTLAKMSNTHTSTITAMIFSDKNTEQPVVDRVAEALGVDVRIVSQWAGRTRTVRDPYVPPVEADMLTARQRRAVSELIKSMAEPSAAPIADNTRPGYERGNYELAADDHSGDVIGFDDLPHDT